MKNLTIVDAKAKNPNTGQFENGLWGGIGIDGKSVVSGEITNNGHLIFTLSDNSQIDCGVVDNLFGFDDVPTLDSDNLVDSGHIKLALNQKVDIVAGKGLSTNDYTDNEKLKLEGIAAGAEVNVNSDWNALSGVEQILNKPNLAAVATSGSYADLTNKPTIPIVNDATLTIQKNSVSVGTFTANQSSNETINITVPTSAADVSALPSSTKYGATFELSINSSTYVVTATLKDQDGNMLGSSQTIDLPLETMVISGSYDSQNKKIVLTLNNGQTVEFSVADLVSGLQSEITSNNKLSADLVDDTSTVNKFVTATDKTKLQKCKTSWQGTRAAYEALLVDEYDSYQVIEGASL